MLSKLKIPLVVKFILVFSITFVVITTAIGIYSYNIVDSTMLERTQTKLNSDLLLGRKYLKLYYPGDWSIKDGELFKGTVKINDNFEIIDKIGEYTGNKVTIFQGNTRVATNVMLPNGKRAVGTKVSEEVARRVLVEDKTYYGKAEVVGTWCLTAYEPIKDKNGQIIGIWFVGVPLNDVVGKFRTNFAFLVLLGAAIFTLISWILAKRLTKPIVMLKKAMAQAEKDHLDNEIKKLSNDEIGDLAISFNNMVLSLKQSLTEIDELNNSLEEKISERTNELEAAYHNLKIVMNETVNAFVKIAEKRDPFTASHEHRVAHLACAIAKEIGLPEKQVEGLYIASKLHDIGKIYIPADILNKPGKLSELEFAIVKTHSEAGYEILKDIPFNYPVADMVMQHHERTDGTGYPLGLTEEKTLLEAKILAVADVVEAMASHRPYRPALTIEKALDEISCGIGTKYDSEVVKACIRLFKEEGFVLE